MSEPTTESGRALLRLNGNEYQWAVAEPAEIERLILDIEQEAVRAYAERLAAAVQLVMLPLADEDESPAAMVYREVRQRVLDLIEGSKP